jgi:hypothetical protein
MPFNPQKKYKYHIFYAILSTNEKIEIPHIQSTELKKKFHTFYAIQSTDKNINITHSIPFSPPRRILKDIQPNITVIDITC